MNSEQNELKKSYEDSPYLSYCYQESSLERARFLAALYGLSGLEKSPLKVLELGCASGGNIIPMAYRNPRDHFCGIDLSPNQITEAEKLVSRLELSNISFYAESFESDIFAEKKFDYIIAHGLFSWIPKEAQETLLSKICSWLSPSGVAYVSFNSYPGWHLRQMVREMLRSHLDPCLSASDAHSHALRFLGSILEGTPLRESGFSTVIKEIRDDIQLSDPTHFVHDYLEVFNNPVSILEFGEALSRHSLLYFADSHLTHIDGIGLPQAVSQAVLSLCKNDLVKREQYFDYFTCRPFHAAFITHASAPLRETLTEESFPENTKILSRVRISGEPGGKLERIDSGQIVEISNPFAIEALSYLGSRHPNLVSVEELTGECGGDTPENRRKVIGFLLHVFPRRLVELFVGFEQIRLLEPDDAIHLDSLVSHYADRQVVIPNAYHQSVTIDPASRDLIRILAQEGSLKEALSKLREIYRGDQTITALLSKAGFLHDCSRHFSQNALSFELVTSKSSQDH
ncbi:MAG: class I SAM-dependent methyltransferase [Bdellovibrionales bacterium]|nr:class I SAM-dependent methyltransferase [Bdellovibrionales bacterium]